MTQGTPKGAAGPRRHQAPEPLEGDAMAVVIGGTILWLVAAVVLLFFWGRLDDSGNLWWLWTCLSGAGLGLIGMAYVRAREAALARRRGADAETPPSDPAP